jgi:hypothetical protein
MDVQKWSQKKIRELTEQSKSFYGMISEILDGERGLLTGKEKSQPLPPFEVQNHIESLSALPFSSAFLKGPEKEVVFERLAPFFEGGFFLQKSAGAWTLRELFLFGHVFTPPESEQTAVDFEIPKLRSFQVLRTSGRYILRKFNLEAIRKLHSSSAFLIGISDDCVFLLLCNRPQVWQIDHIDKTHDILRKILGGISGTGSSIASANGRSL